MSNGKERIRTKEKPENPIHAWLRLDFIKEGEMRMKGFEVPGDFPTWNRAVRAARKCINVREEDLKRVVIFLEKL